MHRVSMMIGVCSSKSVGEGARAGAGAHVDVAADACAAVGVGIGADVGLGIAAGVGADADEGMGDPVGTDGGVGIDIGATRGGSSSIGFRMNLMGLRFIAATSFCGVGVETNRDWNSKLV